MSSVRNAAILVALVTSACSAGTGSPSPSASSPPAANAAPAATPTTTPTISPPSLLEGIWTTAEITCGQQLATIHEAGFTDAQINDSGWPCPQPLYYRLRFLGDRMAQFEKSNEGFELGSQWAFQLTDRHSVAMTEIGYAGSATANLTFTLVGDVLTFTSVSGNAFESGPVFDQIAGPAIWLSAPFIKEP